MENRIRLAVLGCGAIARSGHLPAVLSHPGVRLAGLVDAEPKRARALARRLGVDCPTAADYQPMLKQVDAIINALPNSLHAAVNQEALRAGVHVLCEKPLATTASDARACCELAERQNLLLAVGMNRRFVGSHSLMRLILQERLLGDLLDFDWEYGGSFDWKSASGFYFSPALAGGGALLDFGVHLLDSLIDWFGPVIAFDYQDDDWGSGIEANAQLDLRHAGPSGEVKGRLRVSRTYTLKNRLLLRGSQAHAEIPAGDLEIVILHRTVGGRRVSETMRLEGSAATSSFYKQLDNFIASIKGTQRLEVDGRQALRVVEFIDECYARRRRIPEPWSETIAQASGVRG